jgi:hypothetical protein
MHKLNLPPIDDAFLKLIHAVVLEAQANKRDVEEEAIYAARAFLFALEMYIGATSPEADSAAEKKGGAPAEPAVTTGVDGIGRPSKPGSTRVVTVGATVGAGGGGQTSASQSPGAKSESATPRPSVQDVMQMAADWGKRTSCALALGLYPLPPADELIAALSRLGEPEKQDGFPPLNFPPKPFKQE